MNAGDRCFRDAWFAAVVRPLDRLGVAIAFVVMAAAAGGLVGCGSGGGPQQVAQGDADPGLSDLKMFLEAAKAGGRKTTRDVALPVIQAQHMAADYSLGTGDIVFEWGAELSTGPEAAKRIVAYQKAAKSDGGWALFQDGSLRRITAAEFAAAPKAER
ncbi:MAG: hypothetical protein ACKON7_07075 [Planctomycetaceae bacterium]